MTDATPPSAAGAASGPQPPKHPYTPTAHDVIKTVSVQNAEDLATVKAAIKSAAGLTPGGQPLLSDAIISAIAPSSSARRAASWQIMSACKMVSGIKPHFSCGLRPGCAGAKP